jgi:MPBQ/MSBQ methyltransferase
MSNGVMRPPAAGPDPAQIVSRYDGLMFHPIFREYFGGSDFANFGYWDDTTADQKQACERLMERLLAFLPADGVGDLLDVACGKGETTRCVARRWPETRLTGINLSDRQLAACRANLPGATFLKMDAARLDFPDASFDAVLCVEAAFHFNTRERFLREAQRVLRPGGQVLLADILGTRDTERSRPLRSAANYLEDPTAYAALLRDTGFTAAVEVEDATAACWKGCYRSFTRFVHEQYLCGAIDRELLRVALEPTYRRVAEIRYYVLAAARKGGEAGR